MIVGFGSAITGLDGQSLHMENQESDSVGTSRKSSKGKIIALAVVIVLAVLISGVVLSVIKKNEMESRFQAYNNGRSLAGAIQQQHNAYRRLPYNRVDKESGDLLLSWRLQLLPYVRAANLADITNPDVAWDSADHFGGINERVEALRSPLGASAADPVTHFVCVVDPKSPMSFEKMTLEEVENRDGKSNTGLFLEFPNSDIHWAEPRDITLAEVIEVIQNSPAPDGTVVSMADGRAIVVPKSATVDDITKLFLLDNGSPTADWLTAKR